MLPIEWQKALHRLWTKATNHPDYVKEEWMELESILVRCAARIARQDEEPNSGAS